MRKLILIFLVLALIIGVEAKILTTSETRTLNKFEDGDTSKIVEDEEVVYINIPKDAVLNKASFDIEGSGIKNVKIKINDNILFENESLDSLVNLDFKNNITTTCDIICRYRLDVRGDGDINLKNLNIEYSISKTPIFFRYIQDVKFTGSKQNALDLDDYFYGSGIKYKNMSSKTNGLDHISVNIASNGNVDFVAEAGWEGTGYVYFVADDDIDSVRSNEIKLIIGSGQEKAYQFSPLNSTLTFLKGEQQAFGVSGSGTFKVDWYLNDKLIANNSFTYTFFSDNIGIYNLEARIGNTKRLWVISVLEPKIVAPELPKEEEKKKIICGDGIRDESENCGNCPADVSCGINAKCVNGACVVEEKTNYTLLILIFGGFGFVVILIVVVIILFKKGKLKFPKFSKKEKIKVEETKGDLTPLRSYLLENLKKGFNKDELIKSAINQGWSKEQIDKMLSEQIIPEKRGLEKELEPLRDYIINGLKNGFKREELINACLRIGWKREQIDEVLKWV